MSAQQPTVNGATSDADEEARIKDAMKRLKLLHIKVGGARSPQNQLIRSQC